MTAIVRVPQVVREGPEGNVVEEQESAQVRRAVEDFVLEGRLALMPVPAFSE